MFLTMSDTDTRSKVTIKDLKEKKEVVEIGRDARASRNPNEKNGVQEADDEAGGGEKEGSG